MAETGVQRFPDYTGIVVEERWVWPTVNMDNRFK